jgi:hypothetical protein
VVEHPVIEHYTAQSIPNPYPAGDLPWQVYHTVRNAVFRCCRRFGKAGPMGERAITNDKAISDERWPRGDHPEDFYVVDDQLNHDWYIYVEIETPSVFTEAWLRDLVGTLSDYPGWGVGLIAFRFAYILVFADKLMVTGKIFENCHDIACVVSQAQHDFTTNLWIGDGTD